jgi:hypothetical protein
MCTTMELQKIVQTLESLAVNVTFSKQPLHFISHMPCVTTNSILMTSKWYDRNEISLG